jgi:hypothetical protein
VSLTLLRTRIRKRLAFANVDLKQPLFGARFAEPECAALAVVEEMSSLVHHEVSERVLLGEVGRWTGSVARRLASVSFGPPRQPRGNRIRKSAIDARSQKKKAPSFSLGACCCAGANSSMYHEVFAKICVRLAG